MKVNRNIRVCVAIFVVLTFMPIFQLPAIADNTIESSDQKFNIVLVIDASGSIRDDTDPLGYRFEAISLFLNRLDMAGHNVGAIVFDDMIRFDSKINPLNTYEDRKTLSDAVELAPGGGWTDVGSALSLAVTQLSEKIEENNLESIIVLLTDGITDMPYPGTSRTSPEETEKSRQRSGTAINEAIEKGIYVFGGFLNHNNVYDSQELFDLVRASRKNENDPISPPRSTVNEYGLISSLDNQYVEIHKSDDLNSVANQFINWLKGIPVPSQTGRTDENGNLTLNKIEVPNAGVSELNITVSFRETPQYILLTNPDNKIQHYGIEPSGIEGILPNSLNGSTTSGNTFWNIKIIDPPTGSWQAIVRAEPNTEFRYDIVLSNNVNAQLLGSQEGNKVTFTSWLSLNGISIQKDGYNGYSTPILQFGVEGDENLQEYEMEFIKSENRYCFSADLGEKAVYIAKAVYLYGYDNRQRLVSRESRLDFVPTPTPEPTPTQEPTPIPEPEPIPEPTPIPEPPEPLTPEDLSVILIVIGTIFLGIATKFAFNKYRHIVRIESDSPNNEYTLFSGKIFTIIGKGGIAGVNTHILSNNLPSFNGLIISQLETFSSILPLPVLKNRVRLKASNNGVEIEEILSLEDDINTFTAKTKTEKQNISVWRVENDRVRNKNIANIVVFGSSLLFGLTLILIGIII